MLDQAAHIPAGDVGESTVAVLVVEEGLAILPEGLVAVHAGTVVPGDGLGHEGGRLAGQSSGLVDHVLVLHQIVASVQQGVEAIVDLLLAGAAHLVMGALQNQAHLLQVGHHVVAQILVVVNGRYREVALLDPVLEADVVGPVLLDVDARVPRSLDGVDLVEGALHAVLEADLVEDEELGLGSEGGRVGDAGGAQVGLRLGGNLPGVARVRLIGHRVNNGEGHIQGAMAAEGIQVSSLWIGNQLHIRFVDGLEALDGGAVEGHAVREGVLEEFAGGHGEVLLDPDQVREPD